jgi:small subunit ribosomal protein S17
MADEEKNQEEQQEETPEETPAEETQAEETQAEETQAEETPAEETPAEETPEEETPKEVEAPAGEADSEGSDAEPAEAEEASSDGEAVDETAEAPDDDLEGLDWKARRRLERSRRPAEPSPQQSPEERAAARGESRKKAASRRSSYRVKRRTKTEAGTGTPPAESRSAGRKVRQGRVVSSKPDKTITVAIEVARRHPQYEKIVRRSRTLHAHDAANEAGEGDLVRVIETRPLSRTKRWRLIEILEKAK